MSATARSGLGSSSASSIAASISPTSSYHSMARVRVVDVGAGIGRSAASSKVLGEHRVHGERRRIHRQWLDQTAALDEVGEQAARVGAIEDQVAERGVEPAEWCGRLEERELVGRERRNDLVVEVATNETVVFGVDGRWDMVADLAGACGEGRGPSPSRGRGAASVRSRHRTRRERRAWRAAVVLLSHRSGGRVRRSPRAGGRPPLVASRRCRPRDRR